MRELGTTGGGEASLVRRALRVPAARGAITAAALGTSVLLVLVTFASYRSVEVAVNELVAQPGIALWVAPRGTDNLVRSAALLPYEVVEDVAGLPGVREASPVLRSFMAAEPVRAGARTAGQGLTLLAIGYRTPCGLGGPARLVSGRHPSGPRQVVLDRAAAHRLGVAVGGTFLLNGSEVEVTGLSARTNLVSTQLVFLDAARAAELSGYRHSTSFVAVGLQPGTTEAEVARRISQEFPGVSVHERAAFLARNLEEVFAGFRPIQVLVSAIGLVSSASVVALLVLAMVAERRRDLAVLLALGASARAVATAILAEAMRLVLAGVAAGTVAALALAAALERWVPTVETAPRVLDVLVVLLAFVAATLVAALPPLARIARTDPAEAFRP